MATGHALCIGLNSVDPNHYSGWSGNLIACEADAQDMCAIATNSQFTTNTLLTANATRDAVISAISTMAEKLKAGDFFLLTYSGHGGQVPDRDGDEDDLRDETWVLYDGQLVDDELNEHLCKFKEGVRIFVLSDSCHSGTVTKSARREYYRRDNVREVRDTRKDDTKYYRYKDMPQEVAMKTYLNNKAMYDHIVQGVRNRRESHPPKMKAWTLLISGCQDGQLSSDGTFNGLFTGTLLQVWDGGRFRGSYRQFYSKILRSMPPNQTPKYFIQGPVDGRRDFERQPPFTL